MSTTDPRCRERRHDIAAFLRQYDKQLLARLTPKHLSFLSTLRTRFQPFVEVSPFSDHSSVLGFEALGCSGSGGAFVDALKEGRLVGVPDADRLVRFVLLLDALRASAKLRTQAAANGLEGHGLLITINTDDQMWRSRKLGEMLRYTASGNEALTLEIQEAVTQERARAILTIAVARGVRFVLDDVNAMDAGTREALASRAAMVKVDVGFFFNIKERFLREPPKRVVKALYASRIKGRPFIVEGIEAYDDLALLKRYMPRGGGTIGAQGLYFELPGPWVDFLVRRGKGFRFGYYLRSDAPASRSRRQPAARSMVGVPTELKNSITASPATRPFGETDAASAKPGSLRDLFLPVIERLGDRASSTHLIFGAKGCGKTHLLRILSNSMKASQDVIWLGLHQIPPGTRAVSRVNALFEEGERASEWTQLWRNSILLSTLSHLHFDARVRNSVPKSALQNIERLSGTSGGIDDGMPSVPISLYEAAAHLMGRFDQRSTIRKALDHPYWMSLRTRLDECLPNVPPMYSFYDCVDEYYENAPQPWLACQHGLLRAIEQQRDQEGLLRGKVHMVAALQDVALWTVSNSTHRERIVSDERVASLSWSMDAMSSLLDRRVAMLDSAHFRAFSGKKAVVDWLGMSWIKNEKRGITEPVAQYLIRHTRLVPRDLVKMGNYLCAAMPKLRSLSEDEAGSAIRWLVAHLAEGWAGEQLNICAAHIASQVALREIKGDAGLDVIEGEAYIAPYRAILDDLLRTVTPMEKPTAGRIEKLRLDGKAIFGGAVDVPDILWQNGVLGCVTKSEGHESLVFAGGAASGLRLPRDSKKYVYRACFIDKLGLQSNGTTVV